MDDETRIRAGDHVFHRPSGETWVVARVKTDTGYLAMFGWPSSEALIADCELRRACNDAEHVQAVEECNRIRTMIAANWMPLPEPPK